MLVAVDGRFDITGCRVSPETRICTGHGDAKPAAFLEVKKEIRFT
jgi:hypothetical protein